MRLRALTWTDLEDLEPPTLLLPLGATEQHGPHLPLSADTVIVDALVDAVTAQRTDRIAAPTLPFGSSGEHAAFPGTLSVGQTVLELAVVELVRSADHFARVAVICWHGGNGEPLARAARLLGEEGRPIRVWIGRHAGADLHASHGETSLMLHLAPELVGESRPMGACEPLTSIEHVLREKGVRVVSPNGILGDARDASADAGRKIFASVRDDLDRWLSES